MKRRAGGSADALNWYGFSEASWESFGSDSTCMPEELGLRFQRRSRLIMMLKLYDMYIWPLNINPALVRLIVPLVLVSNSLFQCFERQRDIVNQSRAIPVSPLFVASLA